MRSNRIVLIFFLFFFARKLHALRGLQMTLLRGPKWRPAGLGSDAPLVRGQAKDNRPRAVAFGTVSWHVRQERKGRRIAMANATNIHAQSKHCSGCKSVKN